MLEKKNVVLCVKMCACAPWIGQGEKRIKILGCAVLYLSVFPCTHHTIEGIFVPKNGVTSFEKTENP